MRELRWDRDPELTIGLSYGPGLRLSPDWLRLGLSWEIVTENVSNAGIQYNASYVRKVGKIRVRTVGDGG